MGFVRHFWGRVCYGYYFFDGGVFGLLCGFGVGVFVERKVVRLWYCTWMCWKVF